MEGGENEQNCRNVSSQLLMEFGNLPSVQSIWKYIEYCSDTSMDPTRTLNTELNVQLNDAVFCARTSFFIYK